MIVKDNLPLSSTEKEGLRYFLGITLPHYKPPKKTAMTNALEQKYKILSELAKSRLAKATDLTITTDIWTETMNTQGYLGLTIHFLEHSQAEYKSYG